MANLCTLDPEHYCDHRGYRQECQLIEAAPKNGPYTYCCKYKTEFARLPEGKLIIPTME